MTVNEERQRARMKSGEEKGSRTENRKLVGDRTRENGDLLKGGADWEKGETREDKEGRVWEGKEGDTRAEESAVDKICPPSPSSPPRFRQIKNKAQEKRRKGRAGQGWRRQRRGRKEGEGRTCACLAYLDPPFSSLGEITHRGRGRR